jgi:hypothetical protein
LNLTGGLSDELSSLLSPVQERGIFQDVQDGANSLLDAAATKVSSAADRVESKVSSAAARIQDLEDRVPQNCSLGTKRFCIRSKRRSTCSDLPPDLSRLVSDAMQDLPAGVGDVLGERVAALSPLPATLSKTPGFSMQDVMIAQLALVSAVTVLSCLLAAGWPPRLALLVLKLGTGFRVVAMAVLGFLCCVPLILVVSIVRMLLEKATQLPSWVEVEQGEVPALCYGALGCALALVLLAAAAPTVDRQHRAMRRKRAASSARSASGEKIII